MKTEHMNGIDVPALKAFVDGVENHPDRRTVGFRVTTEWKGQTKSVGKVSSYISLPQISVHTCTIGIPRWEDVMNTKLVDPN
jgi:hypothetical protein